MLKTRHRSHSFIPQLIAHLKTSSHFHCKFSDLPESYRKQPYNMAAKILSRGQIQAKVFFNKDLDTFAIVKIGNEQITATKTKTKTKSNGK